MLTMVNRATGQTIASAAEVAATRPARRRGLLGRDALDPSAALVLAPCCAIHTAFMRFAIDVVFVDAAWRVVRVVHALPPWRLAWSPRARTVVELAAGALRLRDVAVGDVLYLAPASGAEAASGAGDVLASDSRRMTAARPACQGS